MAAIQTRKIITLTGRLATPIVVSNPFFKKGGCWVRIVSNLETEKRGMLTTVGKLVKGERRAPTILRGYRGFVKVSCVDSSEMRAKSKIERFLSERFLGRYASEGFGKVQWLACQIEDYQPKTSEEWKKLKIRKGMVINCPKALQRLVIAILLHDFVHTEKHQSKIYEQVTIADEEIREACLNHHIENSNGNGFLAALKYYDGIASGIAQKKPIKSYSRYDSEEGKIDFKALARAIEKRQHSAYKLYQFVYRSRELARTVKSMDYKGSLRQHLLLMANLAIDDWRAKRLVIANGTFKLVRKKLVKRRKVSSSATGSEAVGSSATGVEIHPFSGDEQNSLS